ncbi:MAG: hypothetical protein LBC52_07165, partial [Treponema sp.]|nr:hypothetical protein [Treponema sp.]
MRNINYGGHGFLLLSICILFLGCTNPKKTTENPLANEKELYGYTKKTIFEDSYYENAKYFYVRNMDQLKFLINVFSKDELSELIERISIDFYTFNITEPNLMFLEYFPQLKRLEVSGGSKVNVNIEGLKYLHNLEDL